MANTSTERNGEVDLFELLFIVVQEKITVLTFSLIALLLGILFVFAVPQKYAAELTIRPLLYDEITKYTDLNAVVDFREETEASVVAIDLGGDEDRGRTVETVSAGKLLDFFGSTLLSAEPMRAALERESAGYAALADDPEAQQEFLEEFLNDFRVKSPDPEAIEFGVLDWVIEVETRNVEEMRRIVLAVLDHARESARRSVLNQITSIRDAREKEIVLALEDAHRELELAVFGYQIQQDQRLLFLQEQARIARALDIRDRAFEARTGADAFAAAIDDIAPSADIAGDSTMPYYLRGYAAIEEEIRVLQGRVVDSSERFMPRANALRVKVREYETDRSVQRIDTALAVSPVSDESFVAARYNTTLLIFERTMSTPVILAVATFLGLVGGLLYVFLRHGISRFRNRKQTA